MQFSVRPLDREWRRAGRAHERRIDGYAMGGNSGSDIRAKRFDFSTFRSLEQEKGQLALAIMREARALNHPAYAFLSSTACWKLLRRWSRAGAWMNGANSIQPRPASPGDVASRSCAVRGWADTACIVKPRAAGIAHARHNRSSIPDDPADHRRSVRNCR